MIDVSAWSGLVLGDEIADGNRNRVWHAHLDGVEVAVRQSRRSPESLLWELELIGFLATHDFVVPVVLPTDNGALSHGGVVVQRWIHGREPASDTDWLAVAAELQRLHAVAADYLQRPQCCTVGELAEQRRSGDADLDQMDADAVALVLEVFADFAHLRTAVIHGDPWDRRPTPVKRVGGSEWLGRRARLRPASTSCTLHNKREIGHN